MISALVINAGPVITGAYTEGLGLTISEAGTLVSMIMAGSGISMIALIFFLYKLSPKKVFIVATLGATATSVPVLFFTHYEFLLGLFFVQGLFGGAAYATAMSLLGESENQDQAFGLSQFMQILGTAAIVYSVPAVIYPFFGYKGMVCTLILAYASMILLVKYIPSQFKTIEKETLQLKSNFAARIPSLMGLGSLFVCNGAITGIWMYAERMGTDLNIPANLIGMVLGSGVLVAILGTLIPIFVGDRIGRITPYLAATSLMVLAIYCLYIATGLGLWSMGVILLNISWAILLPYQFAQTTSSDPTGKLKVVVPASVGLSAGAGVAIVGQLFDGDFNLAFAVTVVAVIVSAVAFVYSNIAGRKLEAKIDSIQTAVVA